MEQRDITGKVYGYCRISTPRQNIERQKINIIREYPSAQLVEETFTGLKTVERKKWCWLVNMAKMQAEAGEDVTIVFDSISRMSRNAEEGYAAYKDLYDSGVRLVFLKEPYLNTDTYSEALKTTVSCKSDEINILVEALNKYLMVLAEKQIYIAFQRAEQDVKDISAATSEGLAVARANGKQIGRVAGRKYETKKSREAKKIILKNSRDFGGSNTDSEVMKIAGIAHNTYYRYKRELKNSTEEELKEQGLM